MGSKGSVSQRGCSWQNCRLLEPAKQGVFRGDSRLKCVHGRKDTRESLLSGTATGVLLGCRGQAEAPLGLSSNCHHNKVETTQLSTPFQRDTMVPRVGFSSSLRTFCFQFYAWRHPTLSFPGAQGFHVGEPMTRSTHPLRWKKTSLSDIKLSSRDQNQRDWKVFGSPAGTYSTCLQDGWNDLSLR